MALLSTDPLALVKAINALQGQAATLQASALDITNMTETWNNGATTFTGIKKNVTDTASAAGSLLMDLQVGGVSMFRVTKAGAIAYASDLSGQGALSVASYILTTGDAGFYGRHDSAKYRLGSADDVVLARDAAGVLHQRNGVNAQTLRFSYTYTDDSNRQGGALKTGADYVELAAETAGTGADNLDVRLTPAGTGAVSLPGGVLLKTRTALTNGAAAETATLTNGPAAGNPTKWFPINDNGTTRYVPAW